VARERESLDQVVGIRSSVGRPRAETALRILGVAGAALAESLEVEATLAKVAELAVPDIADTCVVDLVDDDGMLRRVSMAPSDRGASSPAHVRPHELSVPHDTPGSPMHVAKTGEPAFVPQITDEMLVAVAQDDAHLQMLRELGLVSYLAVPLVARGRTLGVLSMATSESGRRFDAYDLAFARELARQSALAVDNARLYAEARRESEMRQEMLAMVAHDLRSPLNAVNLATSVLQRRYLLPDADERARKQIATILRSTARMEHLLRDLLDVAAIQAGRLALDVQPTIVEPLLAEAIDEHEAAAAVKGVVLERAPTGAATTTVRCDPSRIAQVLTNVIGNAVKFARSGDHVFVHANHGAHEWIVAVSDTGPGIEAEHLPHLFDPYWSAARHRHQGTGLGLYIAKNIVEAHRGRMWVESVRGMGSTFFFALPLG
jgi:signal transduction histidine kinase